MSEAFQKDMTHGTPWQEVFERQVQRAPQIAEWVAALNLKAGNRVLDAGSGPGYISLQAAEAVGPTGLVYAVDRSADALAYLRRLIAEQGRTNIRTICSDAAALPALYPAPDTALLTMMLHHGDAPAAIVHQVGRVLRSGARVVLAEFHPDGPCEKGPPSKSRIAPEQVKGWCAAAGFELVEYRRQSPEHYMLVMVKA